MHAEIQQGDLVRLEKPRPYRRGTGKVLNVRHCREHGDLEASVTFNSGLSANWYAADFLIVETLHAIAV